MAFFENFDDVRDENSSIEEECVESSDLDGELPSGYENHPHNSAVSSLLIVIENAIKELLLEHSCSPDYLTKCLLGDIADIYAQELCSLALERCRVRNEWTSETNDWIDEESSYLSAMGRAMQEGAYEDVIGENYTAFSKHHDYKVDEFYRRIEVIEDRARVIGVRMAVAIVNFNAVANNQPSDEKVIDEEIFQRSWQHSGDEEVENVGSDLYSHMLKLLINLRHIKKCNKSSPCEKNKAISDITTIQQLDFDDDIPF